MKKLEKTYNTWPKNEKIELLLEEINQKFREAAKIADETETDFSWDGPGVRLYGGGLSYDPNEEYGHETFGEEIGKWRTSTMSCM